MHPTTETALQATRRAHWRYHVRRLTTELSAAEYAHSVSRAPHETWVEVLRLSYELGLAKRQLRAAGGVL